MFSTQNSKSKHRELACSTTVQWWWQGSFFPVIYAQAQWREPPVMCCRCWDCYVSSLTPAHISPCSTTKSDMQPVTQVKSKQQVFHARRLTISSFTLKSLCHSMSVTYDPQCSKQINHTDWHACIRVVEHVVKCCQKSSAVKSHCYAWVYILLIRHLCVFTVIPTASAEGSVDWSCDILIHWSIHVNGTSW